MVILLHWRGSFNVPVSIDHFQFFRAPVVCFTNQRQADKVAEVLAISPAVVSAATTQNARQFFQLPACAVTHQVQPRKTEQRSEVVTQHHAEAGSDARLANGSGGDTTQRARRKGKKRGGRRRTTASSAQGQSMVAAE